MGFVDVVGVVAFTLHGGEGGVCGQGPVFFRCTMLLQWLFLYLENSNLHSYGL